MRSATTRILIGALLLTVLLRTASYSQTPAQVNARTATHDVDTLNVVVWDLPTPAGNPAITGFNVYRKIDHQNTPYPQNPENFLPLRVLDATTLPTVVPPQSVEWQAMDAVLKDTDPRLAPSDVSTLDRGSPHFLRLVALAQKHWRVAVALGHGYADELVTHGVQYKYEIRGVDSNGIEIGPPLETDLTIATGTAPGVGIPTGLQAVAGDHRLLLHWEQLPNVAAFKVYRSQQPNGPYELVNHKAATEQRSKDFDGNDLAGGSSRNAFEDFQRWDVNGLPTTHQAECPGFVSTCLSFSGLCPSTIGGPENGVTYYYRVAAVDVLGLEACPSAPLSVAPEDETPPAAPTRIHVFADEAHDLLRVTWDPVTWDREGHPESVLGYRVYRTNKPPQDENEPGFERVAVSGVITQIVFEDVHQGNNNVLRPPFGEKKFWYQVECLDTNDNPSGPSIAVPGNLRDVFPPASAQGIQATGLADRVELTWDLVYESDDDGYETIGRYLIYRGLCDRGQFVPCPEPEEPEEEGAPPTPPCPRLVYLGSASHAEADARPPGAVLFADTTIPEDSPLCYSYFVKAEDLAQNLGGSLPVPDISVEPYACARLAELTPPSAAVITGLTARDGKVRVDWIGEPIQDIKAYEVWRADTENGAYAFVAGKTVPDQPGGTVTEFFQPLEKPAAPNVCDRIPYEIHEEMSEGFVEGAAEAKRIYYYKVLGVDHEHNRTPAAEAAPVSTFAYSTAQPGLPVVTVSAVTTPQRGLSLSWTPAFDSSRHQGFLVYRRIGPQGAYLPATSLIADDSFLDRRITPGVTYWYQVVLVDQFGKLSPLSPAQGGVVP